MRTRAESAGVTPPADSTAPGPTAATAPLWRAAQVFRLVTMLYAVGQQVASVSSYERRPLSWVLIGMLVLWSVVSAPARTCVPRCGPSPRRRSRSPRPVSR